MTPGWCAVWLEQPAKAAETPYHVVIYKFNDQEYLVGFDNESGSDSDSVLDQGVHHGY